MASAWQCWPSQHSFVMPQTRTRALHRLHHQRQTVITTMRTCSSIIDVMHDIKRYYRNPHNFNPILNMLRTNLSSHNNTHHTPCSAADSTLVVRAWARMALASRCVAAYTDDIRGLCHDVMGSKQPCKK